jgi:DNA-binding MarR family transcriptional regulator
MRPRSSPLQREIRQRQPFRSRSHECLVGLLRTTDLLRRALIQVVEPEGITLQQYNVLRILRGAGPAGLPTLEISERMVERAPGITRLLERLDRKKLVRRRRSRDDRRQVLCFITRAGRGLLGKLDDPILGAGRSCFRMLRSGEIGQMIGLLDRVRGFSKPS